MDSISNTLPDVLSSMNAHDPGLATLKNTEASQVALHLRKSTNLTLYTAEGDKVTLSSFSSLDAGYTTYTSQGMTDGRVRQTEGMAAYFSTEFAYQLSVEGDLSKDELKDIQKAFKTIGKMAGDFFSGNTGKAIERATKLSGFDTISSFEAVLHYERSASMEYARTTEVIAAPASEPVEQIPQAPATPEETPVSKPALDPVNVTPPPPPAAEPKASPLSQSILQVNVKRLIEKITSVVVDSNVETGKLAKYTSQFLDYFSANNSLKSSENEHKLNLMRQIQTEFMMRIEEARESDQDEGSSALEPFAAENEEPLEA